MKIETLKERIDKAEKRIEKKRKTIDKKENLINKKNRSIFEQYNVQPLLLIEELKSGHVKVKDIEQKVYSEMLTIKFLQEDIDRNQSEINEILNTIEKYHRQLDGELEKESIFLKEIPDSMKELEMLLVVTWNDWDKRRKEDLREEYKKLDYSEFIKKYHFSSYTFMNLTSEQIEKRNADQARFEILDLYRRVKEITGEVIDWTDIHLTCGNTFPVLNGIVVGKEGRAEVESILAGGYNIQKLHIRTIVRSL